MAMNIALKPPGRFDFRQPDDWPKWKHRFVQYLSATGLDGGSDARKVSTLLYCLREEADGVQRVALSMLQWLRNWTTFSS